MLPSPSAMQFLRQFQLKRPTGPTATSQAVGTAGMLQAIHQARVNTVESLLCEMEQAAFTEDTRDAC